MQNELNVNAQRTSYKQHKNGRGIFSPMQSQLQAETPSGFDPDEPFPYLEDAMVAIRKYPYAALGAMISIAAVVISAVTVLAVSVIGGMFLMYGQMKETTATQALLLTRFEQFDQQHRSDYNALRAYASADLSRTNFLVGLMSAEKQEQANSYDRTHPMPLLPDPKVEGKP
jgi:hypothetical protein